MWRCFAVCGFPNNSNGEFEWIKLDLLNKLDTMWLVLFSFSHSGRLRLVLDWTKPELGPDLNIYSASIPTTTLRAYISFNANRNFFQCKSPFQYKVSFAPLQYQFSTTIGISGSPTLLPAIQFTERSDDEMFMVKALHSCCVLLSVHLPVCRGHAFIMLHTR